MGRRAVGTAAVVALLCAIPAHGTADAPQPPPAAQDGAGRVNLEAKAMLAFQDRVEEYVALRERLEATLPPVPKAMTPELIVLRQRELMKLIAEARSDARQGDMFSPEVQGVIRALVARVFDGIDGAELEDEVMDENPGRLEIGVNDRYPDTVPLSTVPPQVLAGLPKLPPDVEYRFIGLALILFDARAHMIVDVLEQAIPSGGAARMARVR
jgi:hypothetical protein